MYEIRDAEDVVRQAGQMLLDNFGETITLTDAKERSKRDTEYDLLSLKIIACGLRKQFPDDGLMGEGLQHIAADLGYDLDKNGVYPGTSGHVWVVDPICGTLPFSRGIPDFVVSLACVEPDPLRVLAGFVYDPVRDEMFHALRGGGAFMNARKISVSNLATPAEIKRQGMVSIEHGIIRNPAFARRIANITPAIGRLRVAGTCGLELCYVACGRLEGVFKAQQPLYDYAAGLIILREAKGLVVDFEGEVTKMEFSYRKTADLLATTPHALSTLLDLFL